MNTAKPKNFLHQIWVDYISSGLNITQDQAAQRVDGQYLEIRRIMLINIFGLLTIIMIGIFIIHDIIENDRIGILLFLSALFVIVSNIIALRIAKKPFFSSLFIHIGFTLVFFISILVGSFDIIALILFFIFSIVSFYISEKLFSFTWIFSLFCLLMGYVLFSGDPRYAIYSNDFYLQLSTIFFFILFMNFSHQNIEDRNEIQMEQSKKELANSFNNMVEEIEQRRHLESKLQTSLDESATSNQQLEETQRAMINVMEDLEQEKSSIIKRQANDEAILAAIADGLIVTDTRKRITLINQACSDILGFKSNELIGQVLGNVFPVFDSNGNQVDENHTLVSEALKEGKVIINETRFYQKRNGQKIPVKATVAPIFVDGKIIGAAEAFRDVTKDIEIDRAKTEFVSLASHQLKTPLSAINWYSELLLSGQSGELNTDQKDFVQEISQGTKRMNSLVNALLNVSRIDLGTFAVNPELIDIEEMTENVIDDENVRVLSKKMKVTTKYQKGLPKFMADPGLFRIVLQNIISNAIKYTPDEGEVDIEISYDAKNVLIKVQDTGYGIPESQKDKIFQKLFRADNVVTKETDGTGLGLYIVKSIVDQSHGKIWFDSVEGKGTTFYIQMPLSGMAKKAGAKALTVT